MLVRYPCRSEISVSILSHACFIKSASSVIAGHWAQGDYSPSKKNHNLRVLIVHTLSTDVSIQSSYSIPMSLTISMLSLAISLTSNLSVSISYAAFGLEFKISVILLLFCSIAFSNDSRISRAKSVKWLSKTSSDGMCYLGL